MVTRKLAITGHVLEMVCAAVLLGVCTVHAQLTMLEPNGGEQYSIGDTMHILFEANEETVPQVVVEISLDGGETWLALFGGTISQGGQGWEDTSWVIPAEISGPPPAYDPLSTLSSQCFLRVKNYINGSIRDVSDAAFSIVPPPPPISLTQPNGGESYTVGDTMPIVFEADENSVPQVVVHISVDGGETWLALFDDPISQAGQGWEDTSWVVTTEINDPTYGAVATVSSQCLIRLQKYLDQSVSDQSDAAFSINPVPPPPQDDDDDSGCGSGTGTALLPPLVLRLSRRWRRRRRRA
ncbi:MAG: hypothetical protein GF331_12020 [Chitinivibrionales bacterium]|nr:hypothetical protein [Chitinivibrionales bacterium]